MNTKMKKKIEEKEEVIEQETVIPITKLAPFGNEEMHKLVEKLNEVIDKINA